MTATDKDVTHLLHLASGGDPHAEQKLFRLVEGELRKRAEAYMSRQPPGHLLQTTVLIDEAFAKLVGNPAIQWKDRTMFYCYAARVMRQVLVDSARRRSAEKHGGGRPPVSLDAVPEPAGRSTLEPATVLALHEALERLAQDHPDWARIVELHVFGGWELKDVAEKILHTPYRTVKRGWQMAKALLRREMGRSADADAQDA